MCKNKLEPDSQQMKIWRMRIACWIPKTTNTHTVYAIPIAPPKQQSLPERASFLRSKYIACLLVCIVRFVAILLNTVL